MYLFQDDQAHQHLGMAKKEKFQNIDPQELSDAEKETCFIPRWTTGAVEALHEASNYYLITLLQDVNLLAIHAKCVTLQPRDIQLACRICGDKDWDKLCYTEHI